MAMSIIHPTLFRPTHTRADNIAEIARNYRTCTADGDLLAKRSEEDFQRMLKEFSVAEHMSICITPLVIAQCAIIYARNAMTMARELRLSELKPVSRKIRNLLDEYRSVLRADLDEEHVANIERKSEEFLGCAGTDFFKFWIQINSELKKVYPDCAHMELRTHGLMCAALVGIYHDYIRMVDRMIEQRLGEKRCSAGNRLISLLGSLAKEYAGECKIEETRILRDCRKIVMRLFRNLGYETV